MGRATRHDWWRAQRRGLMVLGAADAASLIAGCLQRRARRVAPPPASVGKIIGPDKVNRAKHSYRANVPLGNKRTWQQVCVMSALTPKADIRWQVRHVHFGPRT